MSAEVNAFERSVATDRPFAISWSASTARRAARGSFTRSARATRMPPRPACPESCRTGPVAAACAAAAMCACPVSGQRRGPRCAIPGQERVSPTTFNRCNLPPWVIASWRFDEDPRPIELQGVRAENRFLFELLDRLDDPDERARRFDAWMDVRFQLHHWDEQETPGARR